MKNKNSTSLAVCSLAFLLPLTGQADIFDASLETAIAFDSNAYRSPNKDYTDYFAAPDGTVTVEPDVQSGFYIPLGLDLMYDKKLDKKWRLIGDYSFNSKTYLDSDLSNADEISHKGKLGVKYKILNFKSRKSSVYTGVIVGDRDRTYYDRDTGEEKTTGTASDDVSDIYSYSSQGFEIIYDYWKKRAWDFKASYRIEERDHPSVTGASEYDNDYSRLDLGFDYRINKTFRFGIDYASYQYEYDSRSSRNESGQLFSSQPLLEYDYVKTEISLKHRIDEKLKLKYAYEITQREDQYVGYNDYDADSLSVTVRYRPTEEYLVRTKLSLTEQDYPNAWNFDRDPALYPAITDTDHKSAEKTELDISVNYMLNDELTLFGDVDIAEYTNSDSRYNYDRNQIAVGIKWIID